MLLLWWKGPLVTYLSYPTYLVDLYQVSLKKDDKGKETNFVSNYENSTTHYNVSNFFEDPKGNIGYLINDGIV